MKKSKVIFNKEDHTYKLGEVFLQGITGILSKHLFQDKYDNVPDFVLQRAASRGTFIHECCELVDTLGIIPDSIEAQNYIKLKEKHSLTTISNEYIVSDEQHFASAIDVVLSDYSLADIKTTAKFDNDYVSWQLSIYAYLFELQNPELKANKLYGIWLRNDTAELIEVEKKPKELIKELLRCEVEGELFVSPLEKITTPSRIYEVEKFLIDLDTQAKEIEAKRKELLEGILKEMEKANVDKWETEKIRLTRRKATTSERFDSKAFKEFNPDLYQQFMKVSPVKSSITLKVI
mgnify:CR=1 FL=1